MDSSPAAAPIASSDDLAKKVVKKVTTGPLGAVVNMMMNMFVVLFAVMSQMVSTSTSQVSGWLCGATGILCVPTRFLREGSDATKQNQCLLLAPNQGDASNTATTINISPVQEELQNVANHLEDRTDFSTDKLRALYSSMLYGLVESDDEQVKQEIDQMITDAIGMIDVNGDGIIDVWEMENVKLPRETGEFLFDDVVACTGTTNASPEDACVSADNVVEFLNMFYGGSEIVSAELAEHISETSGSDVCFSRQEFEAIFSGAQDLETLSAGLSSQPMDLSFVLSMTFGVGTALFVFGLSSPF